MEEVLDSSAGNDSLNSSFSIDYDCIVRGETTDDAELQTDFFHFLIYGVFLNTVGLLGLVGNGISITILSRPNMRSSINCCLAGLASFDTILLATSLLMFGLPSIPEYTGTMIWYQKDVFPWIALVAYPLGIIAQTGSVYLTVTVTVERYVAVCHPLKARSMCTYGRARLYVIGVALFSLLYNLPRFWEITYKLCTVGEDTFTTVVMTEMRQRPGYIQIYITWLYLVVMYLVPFLSLLIFNIFIYKQVRKANHERQRLSRLQKKELGLAVMLLCVVIVFFICNILALFVNILEMFKIVIPSLTMINNFLVTVNSSVNFVIYCIFGQKFRRLFFEIFCFESLQRDARRAGAESGYNGNSLRYRDSGGRSLANGRTSTQCIRLTSWNGSQNHRVGQQWINRRGPSSRIINTDFSSSRNHQKNCSTPLLEEKNGAKTDAEIISPSINVIVENIND